MPSGIAHKYRKKPAPRSRDMSRSAMHSARAVCSGITTPAKSSVILTASTKFRSPVMRWMGARLHAPLASWKARTRAWTMGQAKNTARNSTVGASSA